MPSSTSLKARERSRKIREMNRDLDREGSDASSTGSNHGTITLGSSAIADGLMADSTMADESFAPSMESEVMCSTREVNYSFYPSQAHKFSTEELDANFEDPCQKLSALESDLEASQKLPELRNTAKKYQRGARWSPRKDEPAFNTSAIENAFQDFSSGPISEFSMTFDVMKAKTRFRPQQQSETPIKSRQQNNLGSQPPPAETLGDNKNNPLPKRQPLKPTTPHEAAQNGAKADDSLPPTQAGEQKENIPPIPHRFDQRPYISHASRTTSGEQRTLADLQAKVTDDSEISLVLEGQLLGPAFQPKNTRFPSRPVSRQVSSKQTKGSVLQDTTNQSSGFTPQAISTQSKYSVPLNGTIQSTDFATQTTSQSKRSAHRDFSSIKTTAQDTGAAKQGTLNQGKQLNQQNVSEFMSEIANFSKGSVRQKAPQRAASQQKRSVQQSGTARSSGFSRETIVNQVKRQTQPNESSFLPETAPTSKVAIQQQNQLFNYHNPPSPNPTQSSFILPHGFSDQCTSTLDAGIPVYTSGGNVKLGYPSDHPVNGIDTPLQEGQIVDHLQSYKTQCHNLVVKLVEQEKLTDGLARENERLKTQAGTSTAIRLENQGLKSQLDKENQEKEELRKEVEALRTRVQQEKEASRKNQENLRAQIDQEQQNNDNLRAENEAIQSQSEQEDRFRQVVESMQTKNGHLRQENEFLQSQLQQRMDDMEIREDKLRKEYQMQEERLRREYQMQEERLGQENRDLAKDIQKLKIESNRVQYDQKIQFQQTTESIQRENEELRQSNESLQSRLYQVNETIQTHEEQARREKEDLQSSLQQENEGLKTDIQDIQFRLKVANQDNESLRARIKELESRLQDGGEILSQEILRQNHEAWKSEQAQFKADVLRREQEAENHQMAPQQSVDRSGMQAGYLQGPQQGFEEVGSQIEPDQDTQLGFEDIGESQMEDVSGSPGKSTVQFKEKQSKTVYRRYHSADENNTIQSNTSHRRHHSEASAETGGRFNAKKTKATSFHFNVEDDNTTSRQFGGETGKRPLSIPARQVLDGLCNHNTANCNVCGRISDPTSRTIKTMMVVPRPTIPVAQHPRYPAGVQLAAAIKMLNDEMTHLKSDLKKYQHLYLKLDLMTDPEERHALKVKIDVLANQLEMKSDILYRLHHAARGQKEAGQEMVEEEVEMTMLSVPADLDGYKLSRRWNDEENVEKQ